MTIFLAALHYLALALGFSGVLLRGIRLSESLKTGNIKKVFFADNLWGIAAALWLITGLLRAFGGYEKGTQYYMHNHWFFAKMGLFAMIFILEVWPMVTFVRWRISGKQSVTESDHGKIRKFLVINHIETLLVILIPFFASAMARGGLF